MKTNSIDLIWIAVPDFKKAVKFYTEVAGLELKELTEGAYAWAELQGKQGGCRLGICERKTEYGPDLGPNAIPAFTVDDIEKAKAEMVSKGANAVGDIVEVPGHVRMQTMQEAGNHFQLVQML